MTVDVHNPDHYMASLRQLIAQGRKRIGLLVGAGGPAGILNPATGLPLIPAVQGLTETVLADLHGKYGATLSAIRAAIQDPNIEMILSRVRSLASVIGSTQVFGLDSAGHAALSTEICTTIGKIVQQRLPPGPCPYTDFVTWINGSERDLPVEIFTTNYDLLFEQAFERVRAPYFDGFTGSNQPFFDPSTVANNDLPARWTRLWKLHGSLGWSAGPAGEVTRIGDSSATHLVFPEYRKYEQTQKAPYSALFDRFRSFLTTKDTLLIATGFSFADAHISASIDECLAANPSSAVFAFQFKPLAEEACACEIATRRSNMSVYSPDRAIINGISARWAPGDLPSRDWGSIRATYWDRTASTGSPCFLLGKFDRLARFFAASRTAQQLPTDSAPPTEAANTTAGITSSLATQSIGSE